MKNIALLTMTLFSLSLSIAQGNNSIDVVKYIASKDFTALNLPFSQAVIYKDVIYVSGQIGNKDLKLVEGGVLAESQQALMNIKNILEQNGSSMENVIKCSCMLTDMNDWPDFNSEYIKFFPNNKPARSAFGTNGLALGAKVEIECMAYIKK